MSAPEISLPFLPARRPAPARTPERHLAPVTASPRRRTPKTAYAVIAVATTVLIGGAQMVLSIATTQTTFQISELKTQQRGLTLQSQVLYDEVSGLSSPQYLAANASALGMVVGASPTFLRLSDGAVIGTGEATVQGTVDAKGRPEVSNQLIAGVPLVTDPDSTIEGSTKPAPTPQASPTPGPESLLPPPVTEGLPTPHTR